MADENCMSSSFLLDPFMPAGHWGPSTDRLMAIETEALARALGASMNPIPALDATPSSSSRSSPFFPCSPSPTGSTSTYNAATPASYSHGSPFLPSRPSSASNSRSPTPPPARPPTGAVAAGRITKSKPRRSPSKKGAQIAYIEVDPARFAEMVQQMTGFGLPQQQQQQPLPVLPHHQTAIPMMQRDDIQQFLLPQPMPTLDTLAGFADTVPGPQQHLQQQIISAPGLLDNSLSYHLSEFDDLLTTTMAFPEIPQQQAQPLPPCFPTLESWSY